MPHNGPAHFSSLLFPLSKIPNQTSQLHTSAPGSTGVFLGLCRLSHSALGCVLGHRGAQLQQHSQPGVLQGAPHTLPGVLSPWQHQDVAVDPTQVTKVGQMWHNQPLSALPGMLSQLQNLAPGPALVPPTSPVQSQGAAVQGFRFRPISQKFCHHAVHHAHSRIRITHSMAPLQHLLKSVEKPSQLQWELARALTDTTELF